MNFLKYILSLAALGSTLTAGHAAERRLTVSSFDEIRVEGALSVVVKTGIGSSAIATGDARTLDRLSLRRSDRTLIVSLKRRTNGSNHFASDDNHGQDAIKVALSTYALSRVALIGTGDVKVDKLKASATKILLNGAGEVVVDKVETDKFTLLSFGEGRVKVSGKTRDARVELQGFGSFDGSELFARNLKLTQRGPARTQINVEEKVEITNSGTGDINIIGSPTCFVKSLGSAKIVCGVKKRK